MKGKIEVWLHVTCGATEKLLSVENYSDCSKQGLSELTGSNTLEESIEFLIKTGWLKTPKYGWICPSCAKLYKRLYHKK